jgi:hypothetical protein
LYLTPNTGEWEIPYEELSNPLRGIDTNGEIVFDTNITEANIFDEVAPLDTVVLGKAFLSQVSDTLLPTQDLQMLTLKGLLGC